MPEHPPVLTVAGSTMKANNSIAAAAIKNFSTNLTDRDSTAAFFTASRCVAIDQAAVIAASTTLTPQMTTMPPHQASSMP